MMTEFEQKRGINRRTFILTTDRIIIETKNIRKNEKYELKLDRLGLDIYFKSENKLAGKIFLTICILVLAGLTIDHFISNSIDNRTLLVNYIMWSFLICLSYFNQPEDDIYLVGGQADIVFYRQIPDEKTVLEFIEKVRITTKIHLKAKYTLFDSTTTEQDFYNRINWLKENGIINHSEYVDLKSNFDTHRLL